MIRLRLNSTRLDLLLVAVDAAWKLPWHYLQHGTNRGTSELCQLNIVWFCCLQFLKKQFWVECIKNGRFVQDVLCCALMLLVMILSDQSVVCSVLTPPFNIGSARLEPHLRCYEKSTKYQVLSTAFANGKRMKKNGSKRVESCRTVPWKWGTCLSLFFQLSVWLNHCTAFCFCKPFIQNSIYLWRGLSTT